MEPESAPEVAPEPAPEPTPQAAPPVASVPDEAPAWAQDLGNTVKGLTDLIAGLMTTPEGEPNLSPDEAPVRVPWTHRGFGRR
jgi:hypothetical protein